MNAYKTVTEELCAFIQASPSCFHVIQNITERLREDGFTSLSESQHWELKPGKGYYVVRGDSSVIAFVLPQGEPYNFQIIASHSDSPSFKIKEFPEMEKAGHYTVLNIEKYGGMLCAPWFDRPLSVAGRLMVEQDGALHTCLTDAGRDLLMIPSLAIHMDRKANEVPSLRVQEDMLPIWGDETAQGHLLKELASAAGVAPEQVIASDLFLYNRSVPSIWGAQEEFFSCPRLDDLQCAYASVQALLQAAQRLGSMNQDPTEDLASILSTEPHAIPICCIFDNEEVGSGTKQGADSTFLEDVLERIWLSLSLYREDYLIALARSFMLSADNSHAVHPNHIDKADPVNRPVLNGGVVIKYNANQKYTTDAVSAALFCTICRNAGVPVQTYTNHSDLPGGSTLGNISTAHISIDTVDIGCAQLAMHSPYETGGVKDTLYMIQAMEAFYRSRILRSEDGGILVK